MMEQCHQCGAHQPEKPRGLCLKTHEEIMCELLRIHVQEQNYLVDGKTEAAAERRSLRIQLKRMLFIALREDKEVAI